MLRLIQRSSSRRCRCPIRLSSPSFKTASLSLVTRSSGNDSSATSFYGVDPELAASAKNYSYVSSRTTPFSRTAATDPIKKIAIQVNQLSYDTSFLRELDSFEGHKLACAALLRALSDLNHKQIRELNDSRDFFSHNAVLRGDNLATPRRRDKNQEEISSKEGYLLLTGGELDRQQHQEQHRQQPLQQRTVADTKPLHPEDNGETEQNILHREIKIALGNKNVKPKTLIALFDKAKSTNNLKAIDNIQLSKMVFFLSRKNTTYALEVLKLLESSLAEKNGKLVSVILYRYIRNGLLKADSPELIDELINHIKETYPEGSKRVIYQQIILPEIAMELLKHKNSTMKACATSIMNYVLERRFPVDLNSDVYEAFLVRAELGKCGRDSPFHRLFTELVTNGYRPDPSRVMKLLMGYYPYTDTQPIQEILTSIHKLQSETPQSALTDYKLDMGTLEAISTAAVQEKNIDLNLLIWDLLDLYQYKPTECLFENVILSFALRKRDENAFAALMDMERSGFTPSRALLRRLAVKVSYKSHGRMVNARNLIYDAADLMGTPSMNVLILGLGMRRDIQAAMEVYDHMILNGLVADGNTFDFLIEALYIDAKDIFTPSKENPRPEDEDYVISGMGMIEKSMEEAGIEPSTHFYHEKIRLLCTIGRPEEAKIVLDEAIEKGTRIGVGSIVFLTYRLASNGYFEAANQVVELCSVAGCGDPPEYLVRQLKNREEKWRRRRRPEINHDDDDDSE